MIDVVSDASVVLKWFHEEGEEHVLASRALVEGHKRRLLAVSVLNLTPYEIGNALLRGRAHVTANQVAIVLRALADICPQIVPTRTELDVAGRLAEQHGLTFYDAAYAAVAQLRGAALATLDHALLRGGLGRRPDELVADLDLPLA